MSLSQACQAAHAQEAPNIDGPTNKVSVNECSKIFG